MLRSEWIGVIFLNRKNSMYIHDQLFTVTMYILYTVKLEIMTAVCISVSLHFEEMVRYLVNLFFITKGYLKAVLFVHTNQKKNTPGNCIQIPYKEFLSFKNIFLTYEIENLYYQC